MKLVYLAQIGLFDDWAHTVQIMKMCEAFSENGVDVELVIPNRGFKNNQDPFEYNHTKNIFKITKVPFVNLFPGNPSPFFYWFRLISFLVTSRVYLMFTQYDVLYTREIYACPFFHNVFVEFHSFPKAIKRFQGFIFKRLFGLVVLTSFIETKMVNVGVSPKKIIIAPDAVKLEDFNEMVSKVEARKRLGLLDNDYILGYIGTLKTMGMEKGVGTAISALEFLPKNHKLYVVGGEVYDVNFYKSMAKDLGLLDRVMFTGKVLHKEIPLYISACDSVTAPFPKNEHYEYYMSPLKIFEYMASKKPMVVTKLASLEEILINRETALFVAPNDPKALADAIAELGSNKDLAKHISTQAYDEVINKYTWDKRAKNILNFINKNI